MPPPARPPTAQVAIAVEQAASSLTQILATHDALSLNDAQQVANFVSDLIAVLADNRPRPITDSSDEGDADASGATVASEQAAESLSRAVLQLARAVAPSVDAGEVTLQTPNLNLTTEARSPANLATRPIKCDTASAVPATVQMDSSVLEAIEGVNASLPLSLLLYTVPDRLHSARVNDASVSSGDGAERRRRRQLALGGTTTAAGTNGSSSTSAVSAIPSDESPTVIFSLLQSGRELRVSNASQPINVSVPFSPISANNVSGDGVITCVGRPSNLTEAGCSSVVECRWWDSVRYEWSTSGCITVAADDGTFTCSCTHLTEFIVFQFPTTADELLAAVLSAVAINTISGRAWKCLTRPSFKKDPYAPFDRSHACMLPRPCAHGMIVL